jgi:hypothetical protein
MSSGGEHADALNLTGLWHGQYSYPTVPAPVPFTAALADGSGLLSGTSEEIPTLGNAAGMTLTATLQGRRTGHSVTFLKTYDELRYGYDAVRYSGDVNHDGSEIEGRWTIPGAGSGRFLMIRAGAVRMTSSLDVSEKV